MLSNDTLSRWSGMLSFADLWYNIHIDYHDSYMDTLAAVEERLGFQLPIALRELYLLFGSYVPRLILQNKISFPENLKIVDGFLVIYRENQDVVLWGIKLSDIGLVDPPVYIKAHKINFDDIIQGSWIQENKTLSEFFSQMVHFEVFFLAPFRGNTQASESSIAQIQRDFKQIDFPDWHWPSFPTRFFGNSDVLLQLDGSKWVWIAARDAKIFSRVTELLNIKWEYLSNK